MRIRAWPAWKWLPGIIIAVGVVLRIAQYAANRSLWLDESALALNIVNRSWAQLWAPLDYNQGAPIGFLLIEKLATQLLGDSEYALRFFPLVSGVAVLFLFYAVAKRSVGMAATLVGLSLIALSSYLVYYSSEVKQYSSDVAIALILLAVALHFKDSLWRAILLGVVGAAAIWFSHPAVFVLAGVGASLMLARLFKRDWRGLGMLALAGIVWGASFTVLYVLSLAQLSSNEVLLSYWQSGFMPLSPSGWKWYLDTFLRMFDNPAGLPTTGLAALAFIVGVVALWRVNKRVAAILTVPMLVTLGASALKKYPFDGRLILFLVPMVLLLVAEGVVQIHAQTSGRFAIIGIAVMVLLLVQPTVTAAENLRQPRMGEDVRPVIAYIRQHWQDGDKLYVYYGARPALGYYGKKFGFQDSDYVFGNAGRNDWSIYWADVDRLRGEGRVWLLFSHVWQSNGADEEKLFLFRLDRAGQQLDTFRAPGAATYLYDLSSK